MRRALHKVSLILTLLLGLAAALVAGLENEVEDDYPSLFASRLDDDMFYRKRREEGPDASSDSQWIMGLGVLSNMQQFFDSLRNNLESLESLPKEERDALLGQSTTSSVHHRKGCGSACCRCAHAKPSVRAPREYVNVEPKCQIKQDRVFRPKATAAYLHALRNHRPSHKIRNFVAEPEPANLRGSNHYDPNWLWTGLGRRR